MYSQWVNLKMLALQVHTCTVLINCIVLGFCRYLADCNRSLSCKMFLINIICTYMYECTQISNFSNICQSIFKTWLLFLTIHYMYSTGHYINIHWYYHICQRSANTIYTAVNTEFCIVELTFTLLRSCQKELMILGCLDHTRSRQIPNPNQLLTFLTRTTCNMRAYS